MYRIDDRKPEDRLAWQPSYEKRASCVCRERYNVPVVFVTERNRALTRVALVHLLVGRHALKPRTDDIYCFQDTGQDNALTGRKDSTETRTALNEARFGVDGRRSLSRFFSDFRRAVASSLAYVHRCAPTAVTFLLSRYSSVLLVLSPTIFRFQYSPLWL